MALFRARYDGICAGCRKPFQKKMLIWAEKGRPPVHPHCKGALEKPPSAAVVESSKKRLDRLIQEHRWLLDNPKPNFDEQIAAMGGPRRTELLENSSDEELRWHNQQYAADLEKWLSTQPEFKAKRDAALAEWEQRRHQEQGK